MPASATKSPKKIARRVRVATRKGGADSTPLRKRAGVGEGHRLYRGVEPVQRRRATILPTNQDSRHDVNCYTHSRMMSFGRLLYCNVGFVRGVIEEIATFSIGNRFQAQFLGKDTAWGQQAQAQINDRWAKICDVRGQPFDWQTDLWLAVVSALRDGDVLMVLAVTPAGYPQLQLIPAHRIGSRGQTVVERGPYKGLKCHNGIISNEVGRTVAYQILGDDEESDLYISARDAHLIYSPNWSDQGRGLTALSSVINDHIDIEDLTSDEKFASKIFSMQTLLEFVEGDGIGDDAERFLDEDGPNGRMTIEEFSGGMVRKIRAGAGTNLKAFETNRPSPNFMNFRRELMRGTFASVQWPIEFAYDPTALSGTAARLIIGKANRTIEHWQRAVVRAATRAITFAIARFVKLGMLPFNEEWYRWGFQMPRRLTVDLGREAQQRREDYKLGLATMCDIYGEQGLQWEEEQDQRIYEAKRLIRRCAEEGVPIHRVQYIQGSPADSQEGDASTKENDDDKKKKEADDNEE